MSLLIDIEKKLNGFTLQTTFQADSGITGLLGASGCGKSMTLRCIAGVERPDSGHIELNGITLFDSKKHINLPPQQRHIGYLFQHYALFPNMTVEKNILCGLRHQPDRRKREAECAKMLNWLQLTGLENRRPSQLSGGQQQRVALARMLVNDPALLMLDEPFSALDAHLRVRLQMETKKLLLDVGKPALMVSHSRDEVYHLCDSIAVMDQGKVMQHKETKLLFANPESRCAALLTGCKNLSAARKISEHELEALDWGVRLATALPLRDDLIAVAIRAHYFHPKAAQNLLPIRFQDEMEEPFETILPFRYTSQKENAPALWWRIAKDKKPSPLPEALGVAAVNVLPLYQ
ncbi:MAG: ATP-binding cassette domain-containing protein [Eubacteriales bacterium]|nr:ATP-binding cassette domain-containing protein [Eubacteriales bacterium]